MNDFLNGLGKVFSKFSENIQGRIERIKNEKVKLNEEKISILSSGHALTSRELDRVLEIDKRIAEIKSILESNASDR